VEVLTQHGECLTVQATMRGWSLVDANGATLAGPDFDAQALTAAVIARDETEPGAPNLDDMDRADLEAFAVQGARSVVIPSNIPTALHVALRMLLVNYAHTKAAAIDYRLAGRTQLAQEYETTCDAMYSRLPESVRW